MVNESILVAGQCVIAVYVIVFLYLFRMKFIQKPLKSATVITEQRLMINLRDKTAPIHRNSLKVKRSH